MTVTTAIMIMPLYGSGSGCVFSPKFYWLQLNSLIACSNVHLSLHKARLIIAYKTHKEYIFLKISTHPSTFIIFVA